MLYIDYQQVSPGALAAELGKEKGTASATEECQDKKTQAQTRKNSSMHLFPVIKYLQPCKNVQGKGAPRERGSNVSSINSAHNHQLGIRLTTQDSKYLCTNKQGQVVHTDATEMMPYFC